MQSDWASENLQIIRTLMERSAVYRRALAPVMAALGLTGVAGAVLGHVLKLESPRSFTAFWLGLGVLGVLEAFLLVRQQAIRASEPYWSPPTRRVVQASLPALFAGFIAGVPYLIFEPSRLLPPGLLVPTWIVLYGCALHSAGFFMPRGVKLFGWGFIVGGCAIGIAALSLAQPSPLSFANWLMGTWFGGVHLAYSIYLFFTEKSRAAA